MMRKFALAGLAPILALVLAPALAHAHTPVSEQAALALLAEELEPPELARYQAILDASGAEARARMLRLAMVQPVGDRGAFALRLLEKTADQQQALARFVARLNEYQTLNFALVLNDRTSQQWAALDPLLAALEPEQAATWIMLDPSDLYCTLWPEAVDSGAPAQVEPTVMEPIGQQPGDVIGAVQDPAPQLPDCDPVANKFYRAWSRATMRVVIGRGAQPGEAPWQVQLLRSGRSAASFLTPRQAAVDRVKYGQIVEPWQHNHTCGGALIPGGWVLTAAHCVPHDWDRDNPGFFDGRRVRMGTRTITSGGEVWPIEAVVRHRRYVSPQQGHDIALLKLGSAAQGRSGVVELARPIELPSASRPQPAGSVPLRLTGWGFTGTTADTGAARDLRGKLQLSSAALQLAEIYIRPNSTCDTSPNFVAKGYRLVAGQLCVAGRGGVDSCKGDSGGPIADVRGPAPVLIGLVSYGPGCGLRDTPGVYVDIQAYVGWITAAKAQARRGAIVDWAP